MCEKDAAILVKRLHEILSRSEGSLLPKIKDMRKSSSSLIGEETCMLRKMEIGHSDIQIGQFLALNKLEFLCCSAG